MATFLFHLGEYAQVIEISEQELPEKTVKNLSGSRFLQPPIIESVKLKNATRILRQNEELAQTDSKAPYGLAENYAELGRFDEAIAVLKNVSRCARSG